jgi:hypothetical protein
MWVKARATITRWMAPEVPAPPPSPAEVAQQQAARVQSDAAKEWARRLARIADERRAEHEAREAMAQAAREAAQAHAALRREAMLDHVARFGHWFPGDYSIPRDTPRGWVRKIWDVLRGGG